MARARSNGINRAGRPLLSFRALLRSQLDDTLSYSTLKKFLRALKRQCCSNHNSTNTSNSLSYPTLTASNLNITNNLGASLSLSLSLSYSQKQRQRQSQTPTPHYLSPVQQHTLQTQQQQQQGTVPASSSRLRRKKRSSKRRRHRGAATQDEEKKVNVQLFTSTTDEKNVDEIGIHLNKILLQLANSCQVNDVVCWYSMRDNLAGVNDTYKGFAQFVDDTELFKPDDPLASGADVVSGQYASSSPCMFYSDRFWAKTWSDYIAHKQQQN